MADHTPGGWQPIETAPKDGSYIIAGRFGPSQELKWVKHSRWITAEDAAEDARHTGFPSAQADDFDDAWANGCDEYESCYPTHWMPLEPPAKATAQ